MTVVYWEMAINKTMKAVLVYLVCACLIHKQLSVVCRWYPCGIITYFPRSLFHFRCKWGVHVCKVKSKFTLDSENVNQHHFDAVIMVMSTYNVIKPSRNERNSKWNETKNWMNKLSLYVSVFPAVVSQGEMHGYQNMSICQHCEENHPSQWQNRRMHFAMWVAVNSCTCNYVILVTLSY